MAEEKTLMDERSDAAQKEFEAYDFEEYSVVDASGFEWTTGSDEVQRPIFIADDENLDGPSLLGSFTVVFEEGTANVSSCYASLAGDDIGNRPTTEFQPATL